MLYAKRLAPNFVILEEEEEHRITRAFLSLQLKKMPREIDEMPVTDVLDVLAVYKEQMEAMKPKKGK